MVSTRPYPGSPLVVAYGLGVNSTAMLVEFASRGVRPDHILFPNRFTLPLLRGDE